MVSEKHRKTGYNLHTNRNITNKICTVWPQTVVFQIQRFQQGDKLGILRQCRRTWPGNENERGVFTLDDGKIERKQILFAEWAGREIVFTILMTPFNNQTSDSPGFGMAALSNAGWFFVTPNMQSWPPRAPAPPAHPAKHWGNMDNIKARGTHTPQWK